MGKRWKAAAGASVATTALVPAAVWRVMQPHVPWYTVAEPFRGDGQVRIRVTVPVMRRLLDTWYTVNDVAAFEATIRLRAAAGVLKREPEENRF